MCLLSGTLTQAGVFTSLGLSYPACKVGYVTIFPSYRSVAAHTGADGREGAWPLPTGPTPRPASSLWQAGPWRPAVRGQPPAATQCPPAGSGAASYPGVYFQSRGQLGRAPARCPITDPAFCAAPAPARASPTPRAARMPGRCVAQHGAARCLGTQATPSECPCPHVPSRPPA